MTLTIRNETSAHSSSQLHHKPASSVYLSCFYTPSLHSPSGISAVPNIQWRRYTTALPWVYATYCFRVVNNARADLFFLNASRSQDKPPASVTVHLFTVCSGGGTDAPARHQQWPMLCCAVEIIVCVGVCPSLKSHIESLALFYQAKKAFEADLLHASIDTLQCALWVAMSQIAHSWLSTTFFFFQ